MLTQLPCLTVQPRPWHPSFGSLPWRLKEPPPAHASPTGAPAIPFTCTPSWPGGKDSQVHLSAELSWEPSSANGPRAVSLGACLQTVGVRGSASQPPSWARTAQPKHRPLLSSSQHQALPRWAETAPSLPASCLRHCSLPAQGDAQFPDSQYWSWVGLAEGRELGITSCRVWASSNQ